MSDVVDGPPAKLQLCAQLHGCMGQMVVRIHNASVNRNGPPQWSITVAGWGAIVSVDGGPYILMVQNRFT